MLVTVTCAGKQVVSCEKNQGGKMSAWLIAVIGVVYLVVSVDLLIKGQTGLGIAFVGYALGNVGLTLAALK